MTQLGFLPFDLCNNIFITSQRLIKLKVGLLVAGCINIQIHIGKITLVLLDRIETYRFLLGVMNGLRLSHSITFLVLGFKPLQCSFGSMQTVAALLEGEALNQFKASFRLKTSFCLGLPGIWLHPFCPEA